jgi:arylsulfatase A-like enzyme
VLIYVVDTLRADSLGRVSELARTPHLDRFAAEATTFDQARAHSSWTRPSFASILTGTHPSRHGVDDRVSVLNEEVWTLAEILGEGGYETGFITTNPNVGSFFGFDQGFDDMIQLYARRGAGVVNGGELIARSGEVTEHALEWIASASRPFLLVVLSVDPHMPYRPSSTLREAARVRLEASAPSEPRVDRRRNAFRRNVSAAYMAEVTANDRSFGVLYDSLQAQGILDETLVVVTSDHGEEFWEHGGTQHGRTLYEEVLRVPLIMRFPLGMGPRRGSEISRQVSGIDIVPTVLETVGLPGSADLVGRSLVEIGPGTAEPVYAELSLGEHELHAVIAPPWKLHLNRATGEEALYDLSVDPREQTPVDTEHNVEARVALERLRPVLAEHVREHSRRAIGEGFEEADIPADVRATLEALGYIEDAPDARQP